VEGLHVRTLTYSVSSFKTPPGIQFNAYGMLAWVCYLVLARLLSRR